MGRWRRDWMRVRHGLRRVPRGWVSLALLAGSGLVACGHSSASESGAVTSTSSVSPRSTATVDPSSGPTSSSTPQVATATYVVVAGDSVTVIASRHCTTIEALTTANGWSDGVSHVIHPAQELVLPVEHCTATTSAPASNQTALTVPIGSVSATNPYLDLYESEHLMTDPFYADGPSNDDFGPVCDTAFGVAYNFAVTDVSVAQLIAGLDRLPVEMPGDLIEVSEQWSAFSDEWYPQYVAVMQRLQTALGSGDALNRALLTDPTFLAMLDAFELTQGQFAAAQFVDDYCKGLVTTEGSTP